MSGLPLSSQRPQGGQKTPRLHVRGVEGRHGHPAQEHGDVEFQQDKLQQLPPLLVCEGQKDLRPILAESGLCISLSVLWREERALRVEGSGVPYLS